MSVASQVESVETMLVADEMAMRFGRRVLFRGLSLELPGGASLAVTGANGSGKTTLLKLMAGLLRPTSGRIALRANGETVPREERPLRCGLAAPYLRTYESFTARENLSFLARVRQLPDASTRIDEVLDEVGLADRADDRVATFSSGLKRRIAYAAALLAGPPLLLLDEPRANLDAAGLAMSRRIQKRQRERGGLLVVATNDPDEAERHERRLHVEDYV